MRRFVKWFATLATLVAAGVLLTWAFMEGREELAREGQRERPVKVPPRVSRSASGELIVTLDAATQARIGLKTATPAPATRQPEAIAFGTLQPDPAQSFTLRAPLNGILRESAQRQWPRLGEALDDGAIVGMIEPRLGPAERIDLMSRLSMARGEVEAATAALATARASYESKQKLNLEEQIVSARTLEEARAKVAAEEARLESAQQTARVIESALASGIGPGGALSLSVERGGEVVEILMAPGEAVESGQAILRVARFHTLVAEVDLPIGTRVDQPVSTASIIVPGHEQEPLRGEGLGLAPTVGARTQSQSFLFRVAQAGFPLRPGIAVTGYLNIPGEPLQGVIIPQSAIVRLVGRAWVYVQIA
ncbi:MAG TPA: HlyD family efflux transporter periplasmic adaptor subunit, partial [Phycisphaerae bacterium]